MDTWSSLCAETFCTAYDVKGNAALSSQSGGIGMRSSASPAPAKMASAHVSVPGQSDIDEDDLLHIFEQDDKRRSSWSTVRISKDGEDFADVAKRVSKKKPMVMLKAGRTSLGSKAASSHTGRARRQRPDRYDDVLRQSGRAFVRGPARDARVRPRDCPSLADTEGDNIVIIRERAVRACCCPTRGRGQRVVADGLPPGTSMLCSRSSIPPSELRVIRSRHRRRAAEDLSEH